MEFRKVIFLSALIGGACFFAPPVFAETHPIIFPVLGKTSFSNDFGAPRVGHTHQGNDIFAKKLTPLLAADDGVVQDVEWPEPSYGYFVSLRATDGYDYWYIHINNDHPGTDDGLGGGNFAYAPGIEDGATVVKGQVIGFLGDSGNAETTAPHLHFEIHQPDGTVINPYYSLKAATHLARPIIPLPAPGEYLPYGEFTGGSNIAIDNLDTTIEGNEIVTGAGFGGGPLVRVVDASHTQMSKFYAYDQNFFHGGVDVATGDINNDGQKEIVTCPGSGAPAFVRVFTVQGLLLSEFLAYPETFHGGCHVAVADLDGDGQAEIIISPGAGLNPEIHVYRFNGNLLFSWLAYDAAFRGGVDVAAIPFYIPDGQLGVIVTSALKGGGPEIRTYSIDGIMHDSFYAYDKLFHGGVRVAAHRFDDGHFEILTVPASGGSSDLRKFSSVGQLLSSATIYEQWWRGGFDVGVDGNQAYIATGPGGRRAAIRLHSLIAPVEVPRGFTPPGAGQGGT